MIYQLDCVLIHAACVSYWPLAFYLINRIDRLLCVSKILLTAELMILDKVVFILIHIGGQSALDVVNVGVSTRQLESWIYFIV
jgi:hypothetical protein